MVGVTVFKFKKQGGQTQTIVVIMGEKKDQGSETINTILQLYTTSQPLSPVILPRALHNRLTRIITNLDPVIGQSTPDEISHLVHI